MTAATVRALRADARRWALEAQAAAEAGDLHTAALYLRWAETSRRQADALERRDP